MRNLPKVKFPKNQLSKEAIDALKLNPKRSILTYENIPQDDD